MLPCQQARPWGAVGTSDPNIQFVRLLQEPAAEALSKDSIAGLNQRLEALQNKGRERLIKQVTAGQQEAQ